MENAQSILATCPIRSEWEASIIQVGTRINLLALRWFLSNIYMAWLGQGFSRLLITTRSTKFSKVFSHFRLSVARQVLQLYRLSCKSILPERTNQFCQVKKGFVSMIISTVCSTKVPEVIILFCKTTCMTRWMDFFFNNWIGCRYRKTSNTPKYLTEPVTLICNFTIQKPHGSLG